ncbi:hypothetical protein Apa02nite_014870 [Actinoplanes palleronii]|uniref:Uncharacterized protein n=2 Tax=Actinoplanes palleronii TaxID=113570 RepID=A0ABQ4B3Y7_9ACTN|nr:hypothetical protein Apa02nite_014870 [Actinoplanes palleronii]
MFEAGQRAEQVRLIMQTPPHEPSADARRAEILQSRIAAAGRLIHTALQEQLRLESGDRDLQLLDLVWDLQSALCIRPPAAPEPPVVPGRS